MMKQKKSCCLCNFQLCKDAINPEFLWINITSVKKHVMFLRRQCILVWEVNEAMETIIRYLFIILFAFQCTSFEKSGIKDNESSDIDQLFETFHRSDTQLKDKSLFALIFNCYILGKNYHNLLLVKKNPSCRTAFIGLRVYNRPSCPHSLQTVHHAYPIVA